MMEAVMHVDGEATTGAMGPRARTRTCVGCNERVDLGDPGQADVVRLILGPGGEIAVDSSSRGRGGGGMGRGAHVHARRACVDRAARAGLLRATRGAARFVVTSDAGEADKPEALSTDSLARAIQGSMDRRIEGLLGAAVRSRQLSAGGGAVTEACRRSEAKLVLVARDAAGLAELTEVRRAVAEGRAVAWGTKERLGVIIAPGAVRGRLAPPVVPLSPVQPATVGGTPDLAGSPAPELRGFEGVGVVAIASRTIAEALRTAVQAASAVTSLEVTTTGARPPNPRHLQASPLARPGNRRGERGPTGSGGAGRARDRRDG
jgi:predicted RNA-binding protein YlxR (DUF448 family)